MEVLVLSQKKAEKFVKSNKTRTLAVISITNPGQKPADIEEGGMVAALFRMSFYDLEVDMGPFPCAKEEDLEGLRDFVDHLPKVELLLVHCAAGISRSAAVAAATQLYLGMEDTIWNSPKFHPNARVYRLCLKEYGMEKTEEFYRNLFAMTIEE